MSIHTDRETDYFTPAKLIKPNASNISPMRRLHSTLHDALQGSSIVWAHAPAGSGKTTAISGYLHVNNIDNIWYNLDEGDNDVASFIYHFTMALTKSGMTFTDKLPLFTPEYHLNHNVFIRNYFRYVYHHVHNRIIVFDDFPNTANYEILHDLFFTALEEAIGDVKIIILSRYAPPARFTKLLLNDSFTTLSPLSFLLNDQEIESLISSKHLATHFTHEDIHHLSLSIHQYTNGWITGILLILYSSHFSEFRETESEEKKRLIFDYLASEFFRHLDKSKQEALFVCALLPKIHLSVINHLNNHEIDFQILNDLYKQGFFTSFIQHQTPYYEFHPLLRSFLVNQALRQLGPSKWNESKIYVADTLANIGNIDAALTLYSESCNWEGFIKLLVANAKALLSQGRHAVLSNWINLIPDSYKGNNPWLSYFQGLCFLYNRPCESRNYLQDAFYIFEISGDPDGLYLSWASIIKTYIYEWNEFESAHVWIDKFEQLNKKFPDLENKEVLSHVTYAFIAICSFTRPDHPFISHWISQAELLLHESDNIDIQVLMVNALCPYYFWMGKTDKLEIVLNIATVLITNNNISPLSKVITYLALTSACWMLGKAEKAVEIAQEGLEYYKNNNIYVLQIELMSQYAIALMSINQIQDAEKIFNQIKTSKTNFKQLELGHLHYLQGLLHLFHNDAKNADKYLLVSYSMAEQSRFIFPGSLICSKLAQSSILQDKYTEANTYIQNIHSLGKRCNSKQLLFLSLLLTIWLEIRSGNHREAQILITGICPDDFTCNNAYAVSLLHQDMLYDISEFILNMDKRSLAYAIIEHYDIKPKLNRSSCKHWSYPVKIYTMGKFEIYADNIKVLFTGKTQKRPLEMIKALISFGAFNVNSEYIIEALWPEAEGDAAYDALKTTIQRTRKLLKLKDALIFQEGKLSLNPQRCWIENVFLEKMYPALCENEDFELFITENLYNGDFLDGEAEEYWILQKRNTIRTAVIKNILLVAKSFENNNQLEEAIQIYRKGIDIDDLSENLYQGLMRCLARQEDWNELKKSYIQCEKTLQHKLNVSPSKLTRKIMELTVR